MDLNAVAVKYVSVYPLIAKYSDTNWCSSNITAFAKALQAPKNNLLNKLLRRLKFIAMPFFKYLKKVGR